MSKTRIIHPLAVRLTHWVGAYAMACMIASGWRIYDASPLFGFTFPGWITLGGWLGGALAWHFAAMWLLVACGLIYVVHGVLSGHFRRDLAPAGPRAVARDLGAALRFRLDHHLGVYNAVQRLFYLAALILGIGSVVSGVAIWKPVQFAPLTALLGGYDVARYVHFYAMAGIVAFILVHLALVVLVPRTLPPMITGRARV